jgi:hypothetical protein
MSKLYELRKGTKFLVLDDEIKLPVAHREIDVSSVYTFDHIDGMYSFCLDDNTKPVHFAAWTEVQEIE